MIPMLVPSVHFRSLPFTSRHFRSLQLVAVVCSQSTRSPSMAYDIEKFISPFRVSDGKGFKLDDFDPDETLGLEERKDEAKDVLKDGVKMLAQLQDKLYAMDRWAVLLIFQAMDAAGKDGAIKHVMSGVNPQGCQVFAFK